MDEYLDFPCGDRYVLKQETNLVEGRGLYFPRSALERTLVVTGTPGCGKTSLREMLLGRCIDLEEANYTETRSTLTSKPERAKYFFNVSVGGSLFGTYPILETDLLFDDGTDQKMAVELALLSPYSSYDFSGVEIPDFLRNLSFEFRLFEPELIVRLIRERAIEQFKLIKTQLEEKGEVRGLCVHDPALASLNPTHINGARSLLMQAAMFLQSQGVDVYVRRSFDGLPLRIVEEVDLFELARETSLATGT